jgi:CO/xanthine dehydrogenase FAD-binding subunit
MEIPLQHKRFECLQPSSLAEALEMLQAQHDLPIQPLAGGTDLYVYLNAGILPSCTFLDLSRLEELRFITPKDDVIEIGALTSFTFIRNHQQLQKEFPMLAEAAAVIGAVQIQNRATIGGNVANGSPAGDSLPVLLAYDAVIQLASKKGRRQIPYDEFYTGYRRSQMREDELIEKIVLPRRNPHGKVHQQFRKVGTRRAQAISKVVAAFWVETMNGRVNVCRIAYGSVAPTPIRLQKVEGVLNGQPLTDATVETAITMLREEIKPIDDVRSAAFYRQKVSENIFRRFLENSPVKGLPEKPQRGRAATKKKISSG